MESIFPKFSSIGINDDVSAISGLFLKSFKYISIVMSFVVLIFLTYSYEILQIWLGKNFADTSNSVLQILTIGLFFNAIATVPFFLLQGIGKPNIPAKIHVVELIIFAVMFYFMIKNFGLIGAAITWTCRTLFDFLMLFLATHHIQRKLFSGDDFKLIMRLFIIIPLIIGLSFYLQLINHSLLLKVLLSLGLGSTMFLLVWNFTIKSIEKEMILNKIKSIYFRFTK
jgi:O-antigen/teichoic acid export membrane protein